MSIEFEENEYASSMNTIEPNTSSWLVRKGIVPNEKTANYVLIGLVVVCLAIAVMVFSEVSKEDPKMKVSGPKKLEEIISRQ